MQLTQIDSFLMRALYLSAAGIVLFQVLGYNSIVSLLFSLTFIIAIALWLFAAIQDISRLEMLILATVVLTFANIVLDARIHIEIISFSYLKKFIFFSFTLLFFGTVCKLPINRDLKHFFMGLNSFLAVFLIIYYFLNIDSVYYFNGIPTDYLTFNFTNPNLTAMFLFCIATVELLHLFTDEALLTKAGHFFLFGMQVWFINETQSRTSLLSVLVVAFMCAILLLTKDGFRIPVLFSGFISIFPLLFAMVYLAIVEVPFFQELFSFLRSEGKELSSRVYVWTKAFNLYAQSPVWGAYSQITTDGVTGQLHNTHVDMLVSYGTVSTVLVCCILHLILRSNKPPTSKFETACSFCFAGAILLGLGEAAIFSGGLGIYLFAGVFLLLRSKDQ